MRDPEVENKLEEPETKKSDTKSSGKKQMRAKRDTKQCMISI